MDLVPKSELLARVADVVARLREASAYCGLALEQDIAVLEQTLSAIEAEHAGTVDDFQDRAYRKHNVSHFDPDRDESNVPPGMGGWWNKLRAPRKE